MLKDKLKNLRIENNYTQKEIADKIGVARNTYGCYENGIRIPSNAILVQIADIYNIDANILINDNKNNNENAKIDYRKILKDIRIKYNYTQKDVAEGSGIPLRTYQTYEKELKNIDINVFIKLANFYNVSLDNLIGRNADMQIDIPADNLKNKKIRNAIDNNTFINKKICSLRKANGYTLKEAAEKLGITEGSLQGYESGKHLPSSGLLLKLCKLYNVSSDDLLGLNIDNPNEIPKEIEKEIEFTDDDTEFLNAYCSLPQDYRERFRNNKEIIKLLQLNGSKGDAGVIEAYLILTPEERKIVREDKRIKRYLNLK